MFICFAFVLLFGFISTQDWNYHDQSAWIQQSNSCGGNRQSPVNIDTKLVKPNPLLKLNFYGYDVEYKNLTLSNQGNTAVLKIGPGQSSPKIDGSAVGSKYVFDSLHFHWGFSNSRGSDHSLDGSFGAAEVHFVHYKQEYGSYANAITQSDGIAVVGVVVNLNRVENKVLNPIIRALPQILAVNSSTALNSIPSFNFSQLFPKNMETFFTYPGSFTVPPCSEIITWIVFYEPITMSAFQVSQFRELIGSDNQRLISSRRWIQELDGRVVQVSLRKKENDSDN